VLPGAHGPLIRPVPIQPVLQLRNAETPGSAAHFARTAAVEQLLVTPHLGDRDGELYTSG
jgi:hypothetical protein